MSDSKIALVYFSATNVTKTYAEVIQDALQRRGCAAQAFNVTPYASRKEGLPVGEFNGFIFGFPVFADFAPSVINAWIPTLDGKGAPCAMFFTYGARTTGYAHFHTRELLEKANFRVQFSAEFLGRHTFNVAGWRVLPDRPDERDFTVAREFAALAIERFSQASPHGFALQKPFGYNQILDLLRSKKKSAERGWCHPVRFVEQCRLCRRCETECPNQAFDADTGLSNPLQCIECMHCVYACPDKALKIDDRMKDVYEAFLADRHLNDEIMNAKQSKIITAAWQAAS
jgi:ferredoxin/flavodoxin